jgi:quinol monooxygenase YgiN
MIHALAELIFQAKLERGCLDCRLFVEHAKPQSLYYVEQWFSLQDFEEQLQSERLGMLFAIMETASRPPYLEVRAVSEQRGLDYLRAVRLGTDLDGGNTPPSTKQKEKPTQN